MKLFDNYFKSNYLFILIAKKAFYYQIDSINFISFTNYYY